MNYSYKHLVVAALIAPLFLLGNVASGSNSSSLYRTAAGDSLTWTATGDDQNIGTVAYYEIRYYPAPITPTSYQNAMKFVSSPVPRVAGNVQHFFVNRLTPGQLYYFAVKAVDEAGNWSPISNVVAKMPRSYVVGDVNFDGIINISDVIYIINYLFAGGAEPQPWGAGDSNCDSSVTINDVVYLLNYVMNGGAEPGAGCP